MESGIKRARGLERPTSILGRIFFMLIRRKLGRVPVPARIMALRPPLLRGGSLMEQAQEAATTVPLRYKKLAQTLVATRIGCPF